MVRTKMKTEIFEIGENGKLQQMEEFRELVQEHNLLMLKIHDVDCQGNRDNARAILKIRRKYVYLDVGNGSYDSGKYLIDAQNQVWSIAAYGQKNHYLGDLSQMIVDYNKEIQIIKEALARKQETGSFGMIALQF